MKTPTQPLGELGLIELIRKNFASTRSRTIKFGIGDDCAILAPPAGSEVLVTTDFTLEDRHFRRDLHPPESVGHRCLARGLSDLAAMGAKPIAAFLSLALPPDMLQTSSGREWISLFFKGLQALSTLHRVPLAGGDTAQSPGKILADITLIGSTPIGKCLKRSTAKPNDILYITGSLGGSSAELSSMLQSPQKIATYKSQKNHPHLFPTPRLTVAQALARQHLATACIDLSDGLSTDLAHLCRASGVNAVIEKNALPIHPLARKLTESKALEAALNGGEDYELLFSAPPSVLIPASIAGVPITRIGRLTRRRSAQPLMTLIKPDGTSTSLEARGWEHFSQPRKDP